MCKNSAFFDPAFTLLGKDIKVTNIKDQTKSIAVLQVLIKSQKEDRDGKEFVLDVYETKGKFCLVKYFKKWQVSTTLTSCRKLAFLKPDGAAYGKRI